jgi:membrane protease YdiL (CAAX protease family)
MTDESLVRRTRARRGLAVYFAVIVVGSGICEGMMLARGTPITQQPLLVVLNMWMPAIAALVARLVLWEGVRNVSFRTGRARTFLPSLSKAWLYPLAVGFLAYGIAWLSGLGRFEAPPMTAVGLGGASPVVRFFALLGITMTIGVPLSAISATGEELGWRGYMLTRLVDAGVPRPALVSGVIWGAWHVPLIVSGQYASGPYPFLSAVLFMASIIPAACVAARLRLESGSVWPAVAFHSAWNSIIQGAFDGSTAGGSATHTTSIWTGESGLLVVGASIAFALLLCRGRWQVRRWPSEVPVE